MKLRNKINEISLNLSWDKIKTNNEMFDNN